VRPRALAHRNAQGGRSSRKHLITGTVAARRQRGPGSPERTDDQIALGANRVEDSVESLSWSVAGRRGVGGPVHVRGPRHVSRRPGGGGLADQAGGDRVVDGGAASPTEPAIAQMEHRAEYVLGRRSRQVSPSAVSFSLETSHRIGDDVRSLRAGPELLDEVAVFVDLPPGHARLGDQVRRGQPSCRRALLCSGQQPPSSGLDRSPLGLPVRWWPAYDPPPPSRCSALRTGLIG
jgi:hypothetical protein